MTVFNQKKPPLPATPAPAPVVGTQSSLVGKTLLVKGEIYSEEEILIEGRVQGKITVKNRVIIGHGGDVEAEIDARDVVIKGKVKGNVRGSQRVEIVPSGMLHGDIHSPRVVIADSGIFEGNIEMRSHDEKNKAGDEKPSTPQPQSGDHSSPQKSSHK